MKYVLTAVVAIALAAGLGASAQAATPATHSALTAMKPGVASGVTKIAEAKDTKSKKKKKKKKKASHA